MGLDRFSGAPVELTPLTRRGVLQVPFVPCARDGLKESYRAWILTPNTTSEGCCYTDSTSSTARSGLRDDAYVAPSVQMLVVQPAPSVLSPASQENLTILILIYIK